MKRLLLVTLLLLSSGPAYAEWVELSQGGGATIYFDPDTIRRKGDLVKMWSFNDYKTVQILAGVSVLSLKIQREYDCTEVRERMLAMTAFSGNMGSDKVVGPSITEQKWVPVEPGSIGHTLWKAACAKK